MISYIKLFPWHGIGKTLSFIIELSTFHPDNFKSAAVRYLCTAAIEHKRDVEINQTCKVDKTICENTDTFCKQEKNELIVSDYEDNHPLSPTVDKQYLDVIGVQFRPSFNLAAYANQSVILQKLVDLGVDLSKVEKKIDASLLLKLDFRKDVKKYILFLHKCDVPTSELGSVLTKSPQILEENIDDLKIRINYLKSKKFTHQEITRLITQVPSFLLLDTLKLDQRFGFLQKFFFLKGSQVRQVTVKLPKLIICNLQSIRENDFSVKEQMGFSVEESKQLFLSTPKLWLLQREALLERFDIIHNSMHISHEQILLFPKVLLSRSFIIQQRHRYLTQLAHAQYDPKKPGYISLKALVSGTDEEFCRTVAGTCVEDFNEFLKSL